ncbi:MAG TPA: HEAT repeat domain-containing protein [Spirochaetia bacterium]|nr:HEAT repeat domain-containing protein [Spirochaetia bacterium]
MNSTISRRCAGRFLLFATLLASAWTGLGAQESSLLDRWEETLLYGIDSEVGAVLAQIEQAGETSLDNEIVRRFLQTRTDSLREDIVEHFASRNSPILADGVRELLLSDELLNDDFLRVAVSYLSRIAEDRSEELLARYAEIAEDRNLLAATVAIDAIGRNGSEAAVVLLLDLFGRVSSTDLQAAVIRALGEAGSADAVPMLTAVAADSFEESSLRQYAAESLGKIGAEESLPLLTELLGSEDSVLRAYATNALGYYESEEATILLEQALLDSFWRVRVAALEALGEQATPAALPAVAYKARRDPERPVREAAIRTLASLATAESTEVLQEIARNERASEAERILAIGELAEADSGGNAEVFEEIVDAEWSRENSRVLDAIGRRVSENPSAELAGLYAKLLTHPNFIIRIYGMRGIGGAGLSEGTEDLKRIARENPAGLVRRTALAALESLGVTYDPEAEEDTETPAPADEQATVTEPAPEAPETTPPTEAEEGNGFPGDEGI